MASGVAALGLVAWLYTGHSTAAWLGGLSASERAGLLERTLANLRTVCSVPDRPRDFCVEQARLVLQLQGCDQVCREDARAVITADLAVR